MEERGAAPRNLNFGTRIEASDQLDALTTLASEEIVR
jgi:hypothetical protein